MFPTKVRSFGLGCNNSLSRFGAIIAPYLAVELAQRGHASVAEVIIGSMCLLAAVCAAALPIETAGQQLVVSLGCVHRLLLPLHRTSCLPDREGCTMSFVICQSQ